MADTIQQLDNQRRKLEEPVQKFINMGLTVVQKKESEGRELQTLLQEKAEIASRIASLQAQYQTLSEQLSSSSSGDDDDDAADQQAVLSQMLQIQGEISAEQKKALDKDREIEEKKKRLKQIEEYLRQLRIQLQSFYRGLEILEKEYYREREKTRGARNTLDLAAAIRFGGSASAASAAAGSVEGRCDASMQACASVKSDLNKAMSKIDGSLQLEQSER